jgi:hypothetical protein
MLRLRTLLDAEQAAASAAAHLAGRATTPGVRGCLEELHDLATGLCDGLAKRISRATTPRAAPTPVLGGLTGQLLSAATDTDRLRLLNRHQRAVLARVDRLLLEGVDVDLRVFLQEAHIVLARSVARCDDAVAELDRQREVGLPMGAWEPAAKEEESERGKEEEGGTP